MKSAAVHALARVAGGHRRSARPVTSLWSAITAAAARCPCAANAKPNIFYSIADQHVSQVLLRDMAVPHFRDKADDWPI